MLILSGRLFNTIMTPPPPPPPSVTNGPINAAIKLDVLIKMNPNLLPYYICFRAHQNR